MPDAPLSGPRLPAALRALENRQYRLFALGQLISLVGTWAQATAQGWLLYRLTGSASALGWLGFAANLPIFLLSTLGGQIADRSDRRAVLLRVQTLAMFQAAVLAWLTLTDRITPGWLYVLAACLGTAQALEIPSRQSMVMELVGRESLVNAIALNSASFNAARFLGPAAAGFLVAWVGEGWCFALNAASFLAVLWALARMAPVPRSTDGAGQTGNSKSLVCDLLGGFEVATRTRRMRRIMLLLILSSLAAVPVSSLMPAFADTVLSAGPRELGLLLASAGAGALAGALVLAFRSDRTGRRDMATGIRRAALGHGAGPVFLGLLGMNGAGPLACAACLAFTGFCMILQLAGSNALIQLETPREVRGRMMAVYAMTILGMAPFGALIAGYAASHLGAAQAVGLGGGLLFLAALFLPPGPATATEKPDQKD